MKTLTPTNLIAVEVPKDATEVQVWIHGIGFKTKLINRKSDDSNGFYHLETGLLRWKDFKILGEVTDTEISFDLKKLDQVSLTIKQSDELLNENDKIDFRLLLQSNGLYFENPIKKPIGEDYYYDSQISFDEIETNYDLEAYKSDLAEWQSYESKLIKGKLIILKQK